MGISRILAIFKLGEISTMLVTDYSLFRRNRRSCYFVCTISFLSIYSSFSVGDSISALAFCTRDAKEGKSSVIF